ncbi:TPA: acyltransferase [Streptococcus suis]|uniref:Sugar O-acyltransferase n=1 Tax=Streptococcus suis TaxID=1307 RepID=A0A1P8VRH1_STRSU|nr:Sugar O-acyltransferase [Streptococcus suis]HEM2769082.1 acyltransferase [Streptococcus suis]
MKFMKIFQMLKNRIIQSIDPVGWAKTIGVNFPDGGLHLYGRTSWSTEPWIITLGNNVHITEGVRFITHDGGTLLFRDKIPDLDVTKPIVIGNNVYIGNNVLILPGVTIGSNVIIGAGAVVSKNIPDNSVAVGVPAKVIKTTDEYFEKIQKESSHVGHLKGQEKDKALRNYYSYKGNSNGIYF